MNPKPFFRPFPRVAATLALAACGALVCLSPIAAQDAGVGPDEGVEPSVAPPIPEVTAESSALGVRQQRVKRMLLELERKFAEISEKLEGEQPDQAEKLRAAFRESKEMLLAQRMDEITRMLDTAKLETATEEQDAMIADVKELISMLLAEEESDRLAEDLKELEEWKRKLDDLIAQEADLQKQSEVADNKDGAINDIEKRIADLKELIARQAALNANAETAAANDAQENQDTLDQLADDQAGIRADTEKMAEDLARQAGEPADPGASPESTEPGLQPLRQATGKQKGSEGLLGDGKPKEAGPPAAEALENLAEALEQLEAERDRIAEMGPEKAPEMAADQQKTESETGELKDQIAQSPQAAEGAPNLGQAQQKLGQAQQSMGEASKDLAQQNPGEAAQDQNQAREELEQARDEIQKRIDELKEQQKMEQLAQLEAIFREMLERQRVVSTGTLAIDKERLEAEDGELKRALRIALRKGSTEEHALAEMAGETFNLIYEEDRSVVFRTVVENLEASLDGVAELMEAQKTDAYVQSSQKEIELTLEELIAALEKAQEQLEARNQQPQQGQPGKPSLLPTSAELKLMRLAQLRVNRLTLDFDAGRADADLDASMRAELEKMAERQFKLALMATEIAARAAVQSLDQID